jgi:phosphohistidine phosphatase
MGVIAMKVYLVQHGQSVSEEVDPARPLSEKGQKDMEKVARFLKSVNLKISVILQSGKTRATQTAEILNPKVTSSEGIMKKQGLAPNDPIDPWVEELNKSPDDVMIVGHLPFLSRLASRLLGREEELISFQPGGIVCLEKMEHLQWRIRWMVVPELFS